MRVVLCILVTLVPPTVKWVKFTVVISVDNHARAFVAAVKQPAHFAKFLTHFINLNTCRTDVCDEAWERNRSYLSHYRSQCSIRLILKLIFQGKIHAVTLTILFLI